MAGVLGPGRSAPVTPHTLGAIDFGGTKTALAVVAPDGTILRRARLDTPARPSPPEMVGRLAGAWAELIAGLPSEEMPPAVGVAAPGPVADGLLRQAFDWGWHDVPLAALLQAAIGAPVRMDNDVNACCLAELRYGVAVGVADFAWIQLSTGVGGGLVLGGEVYRGAAGLAGEVGHMVLDESGPPCACGRRGCLEALVSGPAIARRYAASGGRGGLSAAGVFAAADAGEPAAEALCQTVARDLGRGLALVVNLLNPALVVLGGGVVTSLQRYLPAVRDALAARVIGEANREVAVRASGVGYDAALLGAALLSADPAPSRRGTKHWN